MILWYTRGCWMFLLCRSWSEKKLKWRKPIQQWRKDGKTGKKKFYLFLGCLALMFGRWGHLSVVKWIVYMFLKVKLLRFYKIQIITCIHRCAFVCTCRMLCGQRQPPRPDCVCTLSEKQYARLNSWHSLRWMSPVCVFPQHSTKRAWQLDLGQNISQESVENVLSFILGAGSKALKCTLRNF